MLDTIDCKILRCKMEETVCAAFKLIDRKWSISHSYELIVVHGICWTIFVFVSLDFVFDFGTHNKCMKIHINCILILFISSFNARLCYPLQAKYVLYWYCLVVAAAEKCQTRSMMIETSPHENWCRHIDKLGRRKVIIFGPLQHLSVSGHTSTIFYAVWVFSSHT